MILQNRFLCIAIIALSIFNIHQRYKRGTFMSAVGGLHINILIFYGLGPLVNTYTKLYWDYIVAPNIHLYANTVLWYVTICYAVYTIVYQLTRKKGHRQRLMLNSNVHVLNSLNTKVLTISFLGYLFSQSEFAISGIGTIFPVCKNLLFPCLILLIYNVRKANSLSVFLLIAGFVMVGLNAFLSSWRSELIMFIFSVGVGLVLRNKKFAILGLFLGPLLVLLILPFQFMKKSRKISANENIFSAFFKSFNDDESDIMDMSSTFLAYRLNYVRESAYVLRGIEKEYIDYRHGETYQETILQLVPRAIWPDKPSFNYLTNRVIPRQIGLVNRADQYTSWGVNYFAEFMYNFPMKFFPLFFLFYISLLSYLDRISTRLKLPAEPLLLLQFSLFFQSLNTVSLTFASTYFLWIFFIVIALNKTQIYRRRSTIAPNPI